MNLTSNSFLHLASIYEKKRNALEMAVSSLLNNELKIDTNNKSNTNFLGWLTLDGYA
jgi:hypothetical protein